MATVIQPADFAAWLGDLKDRVARVKIAARIARMEVDNFGDAKLVGEGVSELRVDQGPGYRIYFGKVGLEVVLLLGGGDKSTQTKDINAAKVRFKSLSELKR